MGESSPAVIPDLASLDQVFGSIKEHFNGHRVSTELTVLEFLRKCHPEFEVTCTLPGPSDFLGYAAAGHATTIMDCGELSDISRYYRAPSQQRKDEGGMLQDNVRFGRWRYTWKESEYLLYAVEYREVLQPPAKVFFVISPRSQGENEDGHSPTEKLLLAVGKWSTELHEEIYVFDGGRWTKNKELWKSVQGSSWDEVILSHDMKVNLIRDIQDFFDNQRLYKRLSVPWKRGLIFHGLPGNGKTISIKALINELSKRPEPVPSLYVKSFDSCTGKKSSIRSIFNQARLMAPCLLIFEDLDSLVEAKIRSYFLNEVDGLEANDGILMIGSTNHLESLDPAISKRPSRFDRKYHFKLPSENERTSYCQFWRRKLTDSDMFDFPEDMCSIIAKMTDGFSFAYLKELFVISLVTTARGGDIEEYKDIPQTDATTKTLSTDNTNPGKKGEVLEESQKRSAVPDVEIPLVLEGNLLWKVIRNQIKNLIDEMDNTKGEEEVGQAE